MPEPVPSRLGLRVRVSPLLALAMLGAMPPAQAQLTAEPYVSASIFHDTNLVRLEDEEDALAQTGQSELSDTYQQYLAGLELTYLTGRQRLYLIGEGAQNVYDNYSSADNDSWLVNAGLEGGLGRSIDAELDYNYKRGLAPFEYRLDAEPVIETEQRIESALYYRFTPEWQLEGEFGDRSYEAPQNDRPEFGIDETRYRAGVSYIGLGSLGFGVGYTWEEGEYSGQPIETSFEEGTAGVRIRYAISGLSSFDADFGYSQRDVVGENSGSFSGYTGQLGITRRISGKTLINGGVYRRLDSYESSADYVLESGARIAFLWDPTAKIGVRLDVDYGRRDFDAVDGEDEIEDEEIDGRQDDIVTATIGLQWEALRWLVLRPAIEHHRRDSNVDGGSYESTLFGLTAEARLSFP